MVSANQCINRRSLADSLAEYAQGAALYANCDEADIELAGCLLTDELSLPALSRLRLSAANYGRVVRHYVQLTQDRAVRLALQEKMVASTTCASVTKIESSHSAYFSRPLEGSSVIAQIAPT